MMECKGQRDQGNRNEAACGCQPKTEQAADLSEVGGDALPPGCRRGSCGRDRSWLLAKQLLVDSLQDLTA